MSEPTDVLTAPAPFTVGPGAGPGFILPTRGNGTVKLDAGASAGTVSVLELTMEPGEGPALHRHTREHELWYVLEGEFRFQLGEEIVHQPAGGAAFGPIGVPHTFQNLGPSTGRLLVVTGRAGIEEFFLTYDRLADGPYDASALAEAARVAGVDFIGPPLAVSAPIG
jgi:mannose-6-phosphate isomerase-like protein (cupin superfamily)